MKFWKRKKHNIKDNANTQNSTISGDLSNNFKSVKNNDFGDFNAPRMSQNTTNSQATQRGRIKIEMPRFDADLKFSQNIDAKPMLRGLSGLRGFNSQIHEDPNNKAKFANIIQGKKAAQKPSRVGFLGAKNNEIESENNKESKKNLKQNIAQNSSEKAIENLLQNAKQKLKERRTRANAEINKNTKKSPQTSKSREIFAQNTQMQFLPRQKINAPHEISAQTSLNDSEKNELNLVFNEISDAQNPQDFQQITKNSMNFDFDKTDTTKTQNTEDSESFAKEECELPVHFVLLVAIALLVCLVLFLPKIFVRNEIYYASREIIAAQAQLDSLREENIFIKRELENIKFKNLTHEFK